jgi:peptidoglycan/LPS O-acetylase OafA/YrhL
MRIGWSTNAQRFREENILSPTQGEEKPGRIPTLDGLRALAIAAVLLSQIVSSNVAETSIQHAMNSVAAYLNLIGTTVFFAISGFLVTTLLLSEETRTGSIELLAFYARRAARVLPAMYLYLSLAALVGTAGWLGIDWLSENGVQDFLSSMFLFRNYWADGISTDGWATAHLWSLAVLAHFYIVWPAAMRWIGIRNVLPVALTSIPAVWLWRALTLDTMPTAAAWQHTDFRLDVLMCASAVALLIATPHGGSIARAVTSPWFRFPAVTLLSVAWIPSVLVPLPQLTHIATAVLLPLLILSLILRSESLLHRFLEGEEIAFLGRISLGMYLWQHVIFPSGQTAPLIYNALAFPLKCVLLMALASASYLLFEMPIYEFVCSRIRTRLKRKEEQDLPMRAPLPQPQNSRAASA